MNIEDIQSVEELVANLVEIVSCNGNVLINVGPTKTALLVTFKGPGAVMARKQFWIQR